jgi:hypothetical protein
MQEQIMESEKGSAYLGNNALSTPVCADSATAS